VKQDERLLHGSSFGAAAAAYAEHRPDYAQAAACCASGGCDSHRPPDIRASKSRFAGWRPREVQETS
jgi:hypothetical protein